MHSNFHRVLEPPAVAGDDDDFSAQKRGAAGGVGGGQSDVRWVHTDLYVVEVKVDFYPGVCFQDVQGPEAFRFQYRNNPSNGGVTRVPVQDCCQLLAIGTPVFPSSNN